MQTATHSAYRDIVQDLASEVDERHEVRASAVIWDHPLGFVLDVPDDQRAEFAQRLRELAASLEA